MLALPRMISIIGLVVPLLIVSGCSQQTGQSVETVKDPKGAAAASNPSPPSSTAEVAAEDVHAHKPGAHGGIMVSLGRDSYHAEAVFEKGGVLRLYTLGKDESRVIDVETQTLKGYAKVEGDSEAVPFSLTADPQDGDAQGRTSQFAGQLPEGIAGRSVDVTIPNMVISGERFRLGFKSVSEPHDDGMPARVADDEERSLYLTPGGIYTLEDIAANGGVTATEKFRGIRSSHDMFPKPGDRICPVTKTKANSKFTWIVGGKSYEFCCPPCVDEFVKSAKSNPDEILAPGEYVKK